MRYLVIDNYENDHEIIGTFDNLHDAVDCVYQRELDTDGECTVYIYNKSDD